MEAIPGMYILVPLLAIALWGLFDTWRDQRLPILTSTELSWIADWRAPFLMAGSIFTTQSFVSYALIYVLRHMPTLADYWGNRYRQTLILYGCMSLLGAIMYLFKFLCRSHLAVEVEGVGVYLFARSMHWTISTPTQWFVFGQVCTTATEREMTPIYLYTLMIHVFGTIMYFVGQAKMRWFCFWASSWCFVQCFTLAFRLKVRKDMRVVGSRLRVAMLVVWTGFPVAVLLRWCEFIGPWHEQVLIFTICDVVTKSITFSAILVSRVMLAMAQINGTVQLVLASHDATVEVSENWQILDNPDSTSDIASYFGDHSFENVKLTDLCINEEHQARLYQAASRADSQPLSAPTPKVIVALRRPGKGGGEMLVECLVSKCCHGRRIIGIAVVSRAGDPMELSQQSEEVSFDEASASEVSASTLQSVGGGNVQLKLALHNCCDVLQLAKPMQRIFNAMFMQPHTACALFAWEETNLMPAIVVCSPRLQALSFQATPMPQPLSQLLSSSMVDRILIALQMEGTILHQWQNVRSPTGFSSEVTLMPLNELSVIDRDECQVQLSILVLVPSFVGKAVPSNRKSDVAGYLRWTISGQHLVCDEGVPEKVREVEPPQVVMPMIQAYMEESFG